jgi:DNA-binding NarL/FixJ family response regulator
MGTYRIVLADDHALFLQGLKQVLQGVGDFEVVGEAVDGVELLNLLNKVTPDMVILDISMPNLRGIEAIGEIKMEHPDAKILMLTMHQDKEYLYQAIAAGADGYFLKKDAHTELFSAIEKIRLGKVYVSPDLSEGLADDWEQVRQGFRKPILTTREIQVLKLIAEGKSNKEIGDFLFISTHTVERHRANILEKLNLKGTADLVKYAIQKGYI